MPPTGGPTGMPGCCDCVTPPVHSNVFINVTVTGCCLVRLTTATVTAVRASDSWTGSTTANINGVYSVELPLPTSGTYAVTVSGVAGYADQTISVSVFTTSVSRTVALVTSPPTRCYPECLPDTLHGYVGSYSFILTWSDVASNYIGQTTASNNRGVGNPGAAPGCAFSHDQAVTVPLRMTYACGYLVSLSFPWKTGSAGIAGGFPLSPGAWPWTAPSFPGCTPDPWYAEAKSFGTNSTEQCSPFLLEGFITGFPEDAAQVLFGTSSPLFGVGL